MNSEDSPLNWTDGKHFQNHPKMLKSLEWELLGIAAFGRYFVAAFRGYFNERAIGP